MYRLQFRRDTAEHWAEANPVLAEGEPGLILDSTGRCKIGDGVTPWNNLPTQGFSGDIFDELGDDYNAVISQGGLSSILKSIVNNNSKVDIDKLDSIKDISKQGIYAIVPSRGDSNSDPIGHLLLTSDPMNHTLNQWVFGNFTVDGNNISLSHEDGCHTILVRSYNMYLSHLGDINTWTKWRYYQQEFIKSEKNRYSDDGETWTYGATKIQSLLSSLKSALEEKVKNVDDVLEFGGIVSGITPQLSTLNKYSSDENCSVVYSKDRKVFLLKYGQPSATITYYNDWLDGDLFGKSSANGRVPHSGKIYIDVTANKIYHWKGSTLETIGGATVQKGSRGTSENYIYSTGTDADKDCVASCNWWIYSEKGRVYVRWKRWGADNNTHYDHDNEEHQTSQYMIPYMGSDNGACYVDGLLPWQWGQRMKDCGVNFRFIQEQLSTADSVNLRYLNFSNGERYDTPISKATTAKAGVMTAADKAKLDGLSDISAEGARAAKSLYAATGDRKLFGPNNILNTNNNTLGGTIGKAIYDSSTPTQYTKGSPFEVFCTQGIMSSVHSEKYMIWFGLRKSATNIERYSCKQVIGQTEEEFYKYGTPVAFRLNDGKVYTPFKGSSGLTIGTSTEYILSRECTIPLYSDLHDVATSEKDGLMSSQDKTKLDNITSYARDLGNFESEEAALDALKAIEISSNSNIVHAHCTYANGAMSITMMQSIENDYCRQVIFNKSKVFQRAIYFTDGTRQEISHAEDWSCLFGDRLQWDSGENKYVLRQFDLSFNKEHTDPIPLANATTDGLMSSAMYTEIEKLKQQIVSLQERIAKLENK